MEMEVQMKMRGRNENWRAVKWTGHGKWVSHRKHVLQQLEKSRHRRQLHLRMRLPQTSQNPLIHRVQNLATEQDL
jgi:hypothetical protein